MENKQVVEFKSDYMVLDIATKTSGWLIYGGNTTKTITTGVINGNPYDNTWIPSGEGRSEKELWVKKKGKLVKKRDTKVREDKLHNRLIHKHDQLKKLLLEYKPRYIVKEMPIMVFDDRTGLDLAESHGIINTLDIPTVVYYPQQWRNRIKSFIEDMSKFDNVDEYINDKISTFNKEELKNYKRVIKPDNKKVFVDLFIHDFGRIPETNDESDVYAIHLYHLNLDKSMFRYENLKQYWEKWVKDYQYNYLGEMLKEDVEDEVEDEGE